MENLMIDLKGLFPFITEEEIKKMMPLVKKQTETVYAKTGKGNEFLGWVTLPGEITQPLLDDINATAYELQKNSQIVVVVGIGGSYLGAKAVMEALGHSLGHLLPQKKHPVVLFAGHQISQDYHAELMALLKQFDYSVIVISKSGTTTEPAIAFRLLKNDLEARYGKQGAQKRIVAITDKSKGALRDLAGREGYKTYVIPDDVGGRYSVLTPVGLLPVAVAGFDIQQLAAGAVSMSKLTAPEVEFFKNPAAVYATIRNLLLQKGKTIELLVNYNPKLHYMAEWWKQLYGESEGKEHKGIFPASVDFTSDLHSMGQYIQDGPRNMFETVISVQKSQQNLIIPFDDSNLDKLNFLSGQSFDQVNQMAELGTMIAHVDGGVPVIRIQIPQINAFSIGQLIYFFEMGCAISGYMLGVNPFDQPGVEAYKNNMFALLRKPGFEDATKKINQRLNL